MSEKERTSGNLQEEKTKIYVPEHTSEADDQTKIFIKKGQRDDSAKETKPLTPEEASAAFVRHAQEEKGKEEKISAKQSEEYGKKEVKGSPKGGKEETQKLEYVYCMECGTKNRAGAKFCIHCGKPLLQMHADQKTDSGGDSYYSERKPTSSPDEFYMDRNYAEGGPYSKQERYYENSRPSQEGYRGDPEPSREYHGGPRSSQRYYTDNPRPSEEYYTDGPHPSQNGYYSGTASSFNGDGKRAFLSGKLAKLICTALICISLLFALFVPVVHQGKAMSFSSSALSAILPNSLHDFEEKFEGDLGSGDVADYQMLTEAYSQFRKMINILAKDGYSSINLARLERISADFFGTLSNSLSILKNISNSEDAVSAAAAFAAMQKAGTAGQTGFIIELLLILLTAAFSVYSIYTVFTSKSAAKRRGVYCILALFDVTFLVAHLIVVSILNSSFKRVLVSFVEGSELSGYFSGSGFRVFESSVGMLLLPLLCTVALIVFDIAIEKKNQY